MTLHKPPPTPDMAAAPLQPLVAVVQRAAPPASAIPKPPPVKLAFKASAAGPDAQQMQSIVKVALLPSVGESSPQHATCEVLRGRHSRACVKGGHSRVRWLIDLQPCAMQMVAQENALRESGDALGPPMRRPDEPDEAFFLDMHPGRSSTVQLPLGGGNAARFDAVVVDAPKATAASAVQDCSVFIVPQVQGLHVTDDSSSQGVFRCIAYTV